MKSMKKVWLAGLIFALTASSLSVGTGADEALAAKKMKLSSKKVTVQKGKKKKVSIKNAKKRKIKWKIKKKTIASIKKKGKYAVWVTGKKTGKTTLTCKVKNGRKWKSFKCSVTVTNKKNVKTTPVVSEDSGNGSGAATASSKPSGSTSGGSGLNTNDSTPTPDNMAGDKSTPTPTPTTTAATEFTPSTYKETGFEDGTDGFESRGGTTLTIVSGGHTGKALSVTNRTANWNGVALNVAQTIAKGASYTFSAWIKQDTGSAQTIKMSMELKTGSTTEYPAVAQKTCESGEWTLIEGTYTVPASYDGLLFYLEGPDGTYDFLVDDLTIMQTTEGIPVVDPQKLPSLKDAYAGIFDRIGNVLSYNTSWNDGYQMQSEETMTFVQQQFNSYTLENEMKPDQLLPEWSGTISVSEAKQLGYVIPDNYKESVVAKLNFDNLDKILAISNQYGIQMRAHVLMWHQQTASRFFKVDYDRDSSEVVSADVMDARVEFYVKTVMKHVMEKEKSLNGKAGSIVYCWDVTNEYIHRSNAPSSATWMDVYGDLGLEPTYVKLAYQCAYSMLKEYGLETKVPLFYNDYNEYDCADDIVTLVNYINQGEEAKICSGIGMQSHITIGYPSLEKYGTAVDKFLATGLQVQVTELDIGIDGNRTEEDQAEHYKAILNLLIEKHKNRDVKQNEKGITGVTIWGLYDSLSWRKESSPLLFGMGLNDPKPAFYSVLEAAKQ